MKYARAKIIRALLEHFEDDNRRIDHAISVLIRAERILMDRDDCDNELVVAVALLHDVGIKISEAKLGYNDGKTQELYGPDVVEKILVGIGFAPDKIVKAKEIVGNHHSPSRYDYPELEVLKQADRIVNRQNSK